MKSPVTSNFKLSRGQLKIDREISPSKCAGSSFSRLSELENSRVCAGLRDPFTGQILVSSGADTPGGPKGFFPPNRSPDEIVVRLGAASGTFAWQKPLTLPLISMRNINPNGTGKRARVHPL